MRVKMRHQMSGTRHGVAWPEPGEHIELPDDEAVTLLGQGMAEAVEDKGEAEKATAPKASTRAKKDA